MRDLAAQAALSGHDRFLGALGQHHTVVLYDRWGTGLSDRDRSDFSLVVDVQVLTDVVDHLRLRRFALGRLTADGWRLASRSDRRAGSRPALLHSME